jgi:hypothetical protein
MPTDDVADVRETNARAFEFIDTMQALENTKEFVCVINVKANAIIAHKDYDFRI